MTTIRAAVMTAPRAPIEIREFPVPDLPPGSALLRTRFSEVCGTDVHLWHGRLEGVPYPIIPGHVSVGTVERLGGPLDDVDGVRVREGDRVVFFDVHRACGTCSACTVARTPTRCTARRVYGITDPASDGLYGGWAEAIYLEPGVTVSHLPDVVSDEAYIGGGCGLITAVHILERAEVFLGAAVLVQGVGAVGLSAIALARLSGAGRVVAVGAPADRLELAAAMGADVRLDLDRTSAAERLAKVREVTGGLGVDVAIEAAGSPRAIEEGVELLRDGGRYVVAGHYTDAGDSTLNGHRHITRKHLEIRGCWGSEPAHFVRAIRLLHRHAAQVPWARIGQRVYGLDGLNEALVAAEQLQVPKALVSPNGVDA